MPIYTTSNSCRAATNFARWRKLPEQLRSQPAVNLAKILHALASAPSLHDHELLRCIISFLEDLPPASASFATQTQLCQSSKTLGPSYHDGCLRPQRTEQLMDAANLINGLIVCMKPAPDNDIILNTSTLQMILRLWKATDPSNNYRPLIVHDHATHCPITSLLYTALSTESSSGLLSEFLRSSSRERTRLWIAAGARAVELTKLRMMESVNITFALVNIKHTIDIVALCPKDHRDWVAMFDQRGPVPLLIHAVGLVTLGSRQAAVWVQAVEILRVVLGFVFNAGPETWSPLRKLSIAIRGDVLVLLMRSLTFVPKGSSSEYFATTLLRQIGSYSVYLPILPLLQRFENYLPSSLVSAVISRSKCSSDAYNDFAGFVQEALDYYPLYPSRSLLQVCDSRTHSLTSEQSRPTRKSKQCSACHCTLYCSEECQTSDWSRHRKECRHLRVAHLRKELHQWLPPFLKLDLLIVLHSVSEFGD
ncbi:hypothetical protein BKA70DRAFT_1427782 [Coprinopsis sp. MPI-PUGE-AT-0042]|nr:hypothetical protein BKA70DRAFT_1427782 [Coprinopsis sp. MPI-PUGE-AT-0042]